MELVGYSVLFPILDLRSLISLLFLDLGLKSDTVLTPDIELESDSILKSDTVLAPDIDLESDSILILKSDLENISDLFSDSNL